MDMHGDSSEIPVVIFVDWLVRHAESNVELAVISNVCRTWRDRVMIALLTPNGCPRTPLLLPGMLATLDATEPSQGSFCAAWFAPEGIQIVSVPLTTDSDDDFDSVFAPSGAQSYSFDTNKQQKDQQQQQQQRQLNRSPAKAKTTATECSQEWRGYSQPWQVLQPFGYAKDFVDRIWELAQQQQQQQASTAVDVATNLSVKRKVTSYKRMTKRHSTTSAVRGATFARPEGYCLCWDYDGQLEETPNEKPAIEEELLRDLLRQERNQTMMYRNKKRRALQRDFLPRVVLTAANKNALSTELHTTTRKQPCVQFLNSSKKNAVRLQTPPFDCGELRGPITIFCVGIATEDGCFVSGIKHRCELGHMYPTNQRDDLIDMSPICIANETTAVDPGEYPTNAQTQTKSFALDDSSCDSEEQQQREDQNQSTTCDCPFEPVAALEYWEEDREAVKEECIHRGQRGPGNWHCYVAVFAAGESIIRIDGINEPLSENKAGDANDIRLDGLTIGSDHCFDMTLCFGEGDDEEGEGSIAELVVFQGRLGVKDIEQLEEYLMKKHGIQQINGDHQILLAMEDEWRRQARAFVAQPSPYLLEGQVPLRIVAEDRSVAWKRVNAVTGKTLNVERIGSKFSTGSSDW